MEDRTEEQGGLWSSEGIQLLDDGSVRCLLGVFNVLAVPALSPTAGRMTEWASRVLDQNM